MKKSEKTIPQQRRNRLIEALDRLIQHSTETNKTDELKKWKTEKSSMQSQWEQEVKSAEPVKKQ